MKKLRKHLETARKDYLQVRYDGDLAADILGKAFDQVQPANGVHWRWKIAAFAAVAAAIILFVRPQVRQNSSETITIALKPTDTALTTQDPPLTEVAWSDMPSLQVPAVPSDMDTRGTDELNMTPLAPDFSISVPVFTLEDQSQQSQQQQSKSSNILENLS